MSVSSCAFSAAEAWKVTLAGGTIVAFNPPLKFPFVTMWTDHTPEMSSVRSKPPGKSVFSVAVRPGGLVAELVWLENSEESSEAGGLGEGTAEETPKSRN